MTYLHDDPRTEDEKRGIDHVMRPVPPWREPGRTECGLDATAYPTISREQFIVRVRTQGKQRSAMTTCMTCWHTAVRHADWAKSPTDVIARDVNSWGDKKEEITKELRALAALAEAHSEEFHGYLAGLEETVSLDDARRRQRRKA